MDLSEFYSHFLHSKIADSFGVGEPKYTVGMSGIELAMEVMYSVTGRYMEITPSYSFDRSPEYWAGWAVAYYEWYRAIPFDRINEYVSIVEIREMYSPYHEADITKFMDVVDGRIENLREESRLKRMRAYAGLSQKLLAEQSGVSVRMIEQYEQKKKDINRASSTTVYRLSRALNSRMEDLLDIS
ncbi:MAG: helix-turn-helix transcriptional regulator [Lachnospiraceae bacterium]|nr:helix-turn-helix transcriptional regulator [Lachnospiraceae bacterium]